MDRLLLTPGETAEALGIGRTKVYELLRRGVIDSVQIGFSRRVPVAALHEYLELLRRGDADGDGKPPSSHSGVTTER